MDPNDENEDVIIAVTPVRLEIYWHKLLSESAMFSSKPLSEKNLLDPSPHSVLIPQLPLSSNAYSLCAPPF